MTRINIPKKTLKSLVADVKRGLSSYYIQKEGNEVPFINIKDVKNGRVQPSSIDRVKVRETDALDKTRIEPGDVIISIKGSAFKAALADESINDFVISANLIAFKLREEVLPEIVVAYLNSPTGQSELNSHAAGIAQKSLNLKSLMSIEVPVPELKKQKLLADYLNMSKEYALLLKKEQELRVRINNSIIQNIMMG